MTVFLVYFTDEAPLDRLGLRYEWMEPEGHPPLRYLICTSVSSTDLGFVRCDPQEQTEGRPLAHHLPRSWVLCVAEGNRPQPFGFRPKSPQ